ncbi:hypothetical protein DE146DRAFT_607569 [Phaeosphaeria sp. MPI-PUGE-AT-0046c]|nr:hypothetical protein DE146DRAFT_607569 [Phaeosphaeria sp. MPI-PUGE-AT-0046c]
MLGTDTPQVAHKKLSLFRHFSRKSGDKHNDPIDNYVAYNNAVRPPSRLRLDLPGPLSSPTLSLTPSLSSGSSVSSNDESILEFPRPPSPHLTKDKAYRKGQTYTYAHRIEIPSRVRERRSHESSSSSTSTCSNRVLAEALPTKPFPSAAHGKVRVSPWNVYLPPAHVLALYLGFLPNESREKWFIYSEGPDPMGKLKVHFHRSITGTKVAELFVVIDVKGEGAGKIVGIKWVGGEGVGNGRMDGSQVKYLVQTTVRSVMGFDLEDGD